MNYKQLLGEGLLFLGGIFIGFMVSFLWQQTQISRVYELNFGNGRIHNIATYRGAAYLMLRMEPGAVSVYDLPKKKGKGK